MSDFTGAILGGLLAIFGFGAAADHELTGYVEGDYVYAAPPSPGTIAEVAVSDGARVKAGDLLFRLDCDSEQAAVDAALARLEAAKADLRDLQSGARPEELAVTEANLKQARAELQLARTTFERSEALRKSGTIPQSRLDADKTALTSAQGRVAQLEATLETQRLTGREARIDAAREAVKAQEAELARAKKAFDDRSVSAMQTGRVERVLLKAGEQSGPSAPVVSILPDGALKVRGFVPEKQRGDYAIGSRVRVDCDGCGDDGIAATVTWTASQAEHTPPVIYSRDERARLVFAIDARPDGGMPALAPGQPVTIRPAP